MSDTFAGSGIEVLPSDLFETALVSARSELGALPTHGLRRDGREAHGPYELAQFLVNEG